MNSESTLRRVFMDFLTREKGYPEDCFVMDHSAGPESKRIYSADLILFDTLEKQTLGLIEFKEQITQDILRIAARQLKKTLESIGKPDLPVFLVGNSEATFLIYRLADAGKWVQVRKEDFPVFKTLSANIYTRETLRESENHRTEKEAKSRLQKIKAWASLITIILALTGGLISLSLNGKLNDRNNLDKQNQEVLTIVDSLESRINLSTQFTKQAISDYKSFSLILDSIQDNNQEPQMASRIVQGKSQFDIMRIVKQNDSIRHEFEQLKEILSNNPLRLIELYNTKTDMILLDKDFKGEIKILQNDLDSVNDKYNFIIGGLVTIIGAIMILAVPNLFQWNKK